MLTKFKKTYIKLWEIQQVEPSDLIDIYDIHTHT